MPDLTDPRLEVGGSDRQPSFQGDRVRVIGTRHGCGEGMRRGIETRLGGGHAGAASQQIVDGLVVAPFGLLDQEPHVRRRWGRRDRAPVGRHLAREHTEQRRFTDTVRSDEPGAATGNDRHIDAVEDGAGATYDGDATGEQGCGHAGLRAIRDGPGPSSTHACHGSNSSLRDAKPVPRLRLGRAPDASRRPPSPLGRSG